MKIIKKHKEELKPDYIGAEGGFILSIGNFPHTSKIDGRESMAWVPHMGIWNLKDKAIEVGHMFMNEQGKDLNSDGMFGAKLSNKEFLRLAFIPDPCKFSKGDVLYTFKDSFILEDGKKQDISCVLVGKDPRAYFSSSNRLFTSHLRKSDLLSHIGLYMEGCERIGYDCEHSGGLGIGLNPTKTGKFYKKFEDVRDFVYKLKPKLEERFDIKF